MLDLKFVTENLDAVRAGLARRGFEDGARLDRLSESAAARRTLIGEAEALRARRNEVSKSMGGVADKKSEEFAAMREEMRGVGDRIKSLEQELGAVESGLEETLLHLPNLPHFH